MSITRLALLPALALALAALPLPALAGEAELKAANELVRLVTPKPIYDDMMKQLTQNMLASMAAQGQAAPADLAAKFQKAMSEALPYDEMMGWSAEVYAKRFTVAELKDLVKFYKTPLGSKLAKSLPEIMGEVGRKTGEMLPSRMPAAMERAGLGAPPPGGK